MKNSCIKSWKIRYTDSENSANISHSRCVKMAVCSVCRAVKNKKTTSEISDRIEEIIQKCLKSSYRKDIASHGSTICSTCKRNVFKVSKGEAVPAEWTNLVAAALPRRSHGSSSSSPASSSSPTTSSASSIKICGTCYGLIGRFFLFFSSCKNLIAYFSFKYFVGSEL